MVSDVVSVASPTFNRTFTATEAYRLQLRRRWFRRTLFVDGVPTLTVRGLSGADARAVSLALRQLSISGDLAAATVWADSVEAVRSECISAQRWFTSEQVASLVAARPAQGVGQRVAAAGLGDGLSDRERWAIGLVDGDLSEFAADLNRWVLDAELVERRAFFESIESTPLSAEQAAAVVAFDNRVQVLAAAGSGKTSVMVARAAYAVDRGLVSPERILLLAFNRAAADELQERVNTRFAAAGIDATGVRAATFHSFGLDLIGAATGRKPRVAPWVDQGKDVEEILTIVDELRDANPSFRYEWDLFRLLYAPAGANIDDGEPDGWDRNTSTAGFQTFAGEVVKSHGERLIADFLYLSKVNYRYEAPYSVDVADASHGQYRPDFYYPDIDVWHEHWALDADGNPPPSFTGYGESIDWKRRLHATHATALVETSWFDVVHGDGLTNLRLELEGHGQVFDWDPNRPVNKWVRQLDDAALARLVRTFMSHVKSNFHTPDTIRAATATSPAAGGFRNRLFLRIYWQIHDAWQQRLAAAGAVDFDDMLAAAVQQLESGDIDPGFELVMVDEFQDVSRARARLTRALVNRPGRHLLAVGDDWQAINRFAGSDLSVMTEFDTWFGASTQLALTTTYRCPQTICDVASQFVSANPAQFQKPMRSAHPEAGAPVRIVLDDDPQRAVAAQLARISTTVADTPGRRATVNVLGRYGFLRDTLGRPPANLDVRFRTVHSSKGLEADYVIIVGLTAGIYGFPSRIADDPVLDLALPAPEAFRHAEERRLFYVALTRARVEVTVIAPTGRMSPFVTEISNHAAVTTEDASGSARAEVLTCPKCGTGTLTERHGRWGPFLGCTNFPACTHTKRL